MAPTGTSSAIIDCLYRPQADDPLAEQKVIVARLLNFLILKLTQGTSFRPADLLGALGSVGGFSCIVAALDVAAAGEHHDGADLVTVETTDGSRYYFGNLPNAFLFERHDALLALASLAAENHGEPIPQETIAGTFQYVAGTVGGPKFGEPRLTGDYRPGQLPIDYVRRFWPMTTQLLDRNSVPVRWRPFAIGMAIEMAFDVVVPSIQPLSAATIVTECAIPMAKLDPRIIN